MGRTIFALVFALIWGLTPFVNDYCALGCERPQTPSCPLHDTQERPAPDQCGHDHGVLGADVVRYGGTVLPLVALATAVEPAAAALVAPAVAIDREAVSDSPPDRITRTAVLRI